MLIIMIEQIEGVTYVDIEFLLFLQKIRESAPEWFNNLIQFITDTAGGLLIIFIPLIVFFCIDKKKGEYIWISLSLASLINVFVKCVFCVYRPWILNSSLHSSELAVPYAKGYSFPSGHSAMTSSVVGGIAYLVRNRKLLCILLICLILLVGFSRLWLGVHTPQDVVCGLLTGLVLIFAVNSLINWAEKDKNRYLYIAGIVNILAILALIYVDFFNTYRIDHVSGELLVNPQKSIYVTFVVYGFALGLLNGIFLTGRFFPFNPKDGSLKNKIFRGIFGVIMLILLLKYTLEYVFINIISLKFAVLIMFSIGLFVTLIYPIIFSKFIKRKV